MQCLCVIQELLHCRIANLRNTGGILMHCSLLQRKLLLESFIVHLTNFKTAKSSALKFSIVIVGIF